jgi:hypothetical protein
MRILSLVATILGIAAIVFGVLFIVQANAGNNEIVTSIAPLTLDDVNPKYDAVTVNYNQVKMAEEPAIQGGTAGPSAMYNYLSAQKSLLGLAKANIGTVKAVRMMVYTTIALGIGMAFAGFVLYRKNGQ